MDMTQPYNRYVAAYNRRRELLQRAQSNQKAGRSQPPPQAVTLGVTRVDVKPPVTPPTQPRVDIGTHELLLRAATPSLAVGMTTCDRVEPTITDSLQSCRHAGFYQDIHVFSQARHMNCDKLRTDVEDIYIHTDSVSRGATANWKACAKYLVTLGTEWVMLLEDDIKWCNLGSTLLYHSLHAIKSQNLNVGLLSAYTSPAMVADGDSRRGGWINARFYGHTPGLWGALALCMPTSVLKAIIKHPKYIHHQQPTAMDYVVGDIVRFGLKKDVKVHVPTLVEHTGEHSTIFTDKDISAPGLNRLRHGLNFDPHYGEQQ